MHENLPVAIEEEKKVISAMMLKDGEVIPTVAEILQPDDFYRAEHKAIYAALLAVYAETGGHCDFLSLVEELRKRELLNKIDSMYLHGLINAEFTTTRAERYSRLILEKSKLRQLMEFADVLLYKASEDLTPLEDLISYADKNLQNIMASESNNVEMIMPILTRRLDEIKKLSQSQGGLVGVSTGFLELDKITRGLVKTDLIILAARPSMGKSALALNIAKTAAKQVPVLVFSLEMSKAQLIDRLVSAESKVFASRIQSGELSDGEKMSLVDAMDRLSKLQMAIDDSRGLTISELRMRAKLHKRKYGLGLLVVDYLQLLQASKKYQGNRVQEVSEISRGLKMLAGELDVPVLALSQLSRGVELRAEKKPQLSDLRESGSIEQDADIVMFLYRDEYYNHDTDNQNIAELILAKNRNGATNTIGLQFIKEYLLFRNLTREA